MRTFDHITTMIQKLLDEVDAGRMTNSNDNTQTSSSDLMRKSLAIIHDEVVHNETIRSRAEASLAHRAHDVLHGIVESIGKAEMMLHPQPPNHEGMLRKRIRDLEAELADALSQRDHFARLSEDCSRLREENARLREELLGTVRKEVHDALHVDLQATVSDRDGLARQLAELQERMRGMVPKPQHERVLDENEALRKQMKSMVLHSELTRAVEEVEELKLRMKDMVPMEMLTSSEANCRSAVERCPPPLPHNAGPRAPHPD